MTTDLLGSLKTYLTKLSDGEKTPQEVAAAINSWARESADSLKAKIHEEVEASVEKMGFVSGQSLTVLPLRLPRCRVVRVLQRLEAKALQRRG